MIQYPQNKRHVNNGISNFPNMIDFPLYYGHIELKGIHLLRFLFGCLMWLINFGDRKCTPFLFLYNSNTTSY